VYYNILQNTKNKLYTSTFYSSFKLQYVTSLLLLLLLGYGYVLLTRSLATLLGRDHEDAVS
jgi:uncharacterized membrane protein YesL